MRKVTLLLPDTAAIVDFLLQQQVPGLEVNSSESSITGVLTEQQVVLICTRYGGTVKEMNVAEPMEAFVNDDEAD